MKEQRGAVAPGPDQCKEALDCRVISCREGATGVVVAVTSRHVIKLRNFRVNKKPEIFKSDDFGLKLNGT